jgi:hypothetical protein
MNFRTLALIAVAVALPVTQAAASGKPGKETRLGFHLEMDANDNPRMIFPQEVSGKMRYFSRSASITTTDVAAFSPFPSEDGQSYGVVFQLKPAASRRLSALTATNQGRWMISQVSGRVVDGVIIDRQVDDGLIVIWKGVTLAEIEEYDKATPRIGQTKKKK